MHIDWPSKKICLPPRPSSSFSHCIEPRNLAKNLIPIRQIYSLKDCHLRLGSQLKPNLQAEKIVKPRSYIHVKNGFDSLGKYHRFGWVASNLRNLWKISCQKPFSSTISLYIYFGIFVGWLMPIFIRQLKRHKKCLLGNANLSAKTVGRMKRGAKNGSRKCPHGMQMRKSHNFFFAKCHFSRSFKIFLRCLVSN